jgi:thioredoxin reductase/Pyruvate/2-oxoacid:ferredoxin oxidoreductase delta subunit
MDTLWSWLIAGAIVAVFVGRYLIQVKRREAKAQAAAEKAGLFSSDGPKAQHPHIYVDSCIGCGTCVAACPEGDVLSVLNGKATIVKGHKCIGHGLCAEACPVGAIQMVMAKASASADMPTLTSEYETSIANLFIAGELGGLALIKNAVNQAVVCTDQVAERINELRAAHPNKDCYDLIIVGAGPAGISASLRATEHELKTLTLEREEVGGTVSKYPRQKLVMTSPVDFPTYGRFNKTQLSKEELLAFWERVMSRADLNIHSSEGVESVRKEDDGFFHIRTPKGEYLAHAVILALGRAGTPRKLGVPGEEKPHVLYRLIEAEHYQHSNILVVGGGDSAVEAAMGLAYQKGNNVVLSYRREQFNRLKDRNIKRIEEHIREKKLTVHFNSIPVEFNSGSVRLNVGGDVRELPNDHTWIFAGGSPPTEFLKATGIAFGGKDITDRIE